MGIAFGLGERIELIERGGAARGRIYAIFEPLRDVRHRRYSLRSRDAQAGEDSFFEGADIRRRSARLYLRFQYLCGTFGHEIGKALSRSHSGAYKRRARKGVHRFAAVVTRSLAPDGERSELGFERIYRAYIFNSECIVRRREHRCDAGIELFHGALSRRSKAHAGEQVCAQAFAHGVVVNGAGRGSEESYIGTFAAETQRIDAAHGIEQTYRSPCKGLRRGTRPRDRKRNDKIRAVHQSHARAGVRVHQRSLSALDEPAAHHAHNRRRAVFARAGYMICVAVMERIIFGNDACGAHRIHSFSVFRQ